MSTAYQFSSPNGIVQDRASQIFPYTLCMLVALSGLPGVGKTTIARELCRATSAVHLRLGRIVVADCVDPWPLTRDQWRAVAERSGARFVPVEIVCSDAVEHRRRVESRSADIAGHIVPTWADVLERDYRPWVDERLVIDTARLDVDDCVRIIRSAMDQPVI